MSVLLVVPCFNEADRWNDTYWSSIAQDDGIKVLFVDDGSHDSTATCINRVCQQTGARSLSLEKNVGKAEAVRHGLLEGWTMKPDIIGFLDADGAFPAEEVVRVARIAEQMLNETEPSAFEAVWAARVFMAGREIRRHASRHYIGRTIATVISPWHKHAIYDTQSGYKLFRRNEWLRACLQAPFETRWFADVELLIRWQRTTGSAMRIWEEPVKGWRDVDGSSMNRSQYARVLRELRYLFGVRLKGRPG